ncbi:MAG: hypothetical protein DCC68_25040 [Planctomycetota bacterium]|nr:MAG: hypothetical protein DCC68_25040 [Planctomycetota bacterium]
MFYKIGERAPRVIVGMIRQIWIVVMSNTFTRCEFRFRGAQGIRGGLWLRRPNFRNVNFLWRHGDGARCWTLACRR